AAPAATVNITEDAGGAQVQVGVDGLLTHTLTLHWLGHRPRAAIIIDDLGDDLLVARELAGIEAPLTFAVIPLRPFSKETAELATLFSRDVLVHLPMEAEGNDEAFDGELRVTASRDEIVHTVDLDLAGVPRALR